VKLGVVPNADEYRVFLLSTMGSLNPRLRIASKQYQSLSKSLLETWILIKSRTRLPFLAKRSSRYSLRNVSR